MPKVMFEHKASEISKVHWVKLLLQPKDSKDSDSTFNTFTGSYDLPYGKVDHVLCRAPLVKNAKGEDDFEPCKITKLLKLKKIYINRTGITIYSSTK